MRPAHRCFILVGCALVLAACGSSSTAPTATTAPGSTTVPGATSSVPATGGPLHFSPFRPLAQGTGIASLSCAATTSCIALDDTGRGYHFDGATWSAPVPATVMF